LTAQHLKIHPKLQNLISIGIKKLKINLTPSTHIFSGIGEYFSNLKELWIQDQSLKFVDRSDFAGLTQLEKLRLDQNQIEFLFNNVFWDLPNLEEIDLSNNKIDYLPKDLFLKNLEIERIWASNNPLKVIDVDFTTFKNLFYINLSNAKCVNIIAYDPTLVQEAQLIINENCRKTTQK
jgi:Leucine-rich repeat (LRR) protein